MSQQFKVPLQTEVAKYMNEKKGWPLSFCLYYAEKFWNFYQSNGWKVSGRAAMKDWKAAFNSNWQNPKFSEDIDKLNACMSKEKKPVINGKTQSPFQRLDDLMMLYKNNPDSIELERYCKVYDWLKERDMVNITQDQEQIVTDLCKNYDEQTARCRGKALKVKFLFSNMIGHGKRFSK